jgi:hypothetical protein
MKIAKSLFASLIILQTWYASASEATTQSSSEGAEVITLKNELSSTQKGIGGSDWLHRYGTWSLNETDELHANYRCGNSYTLLFWPILGDCDGYLTIEKSRDKLLKKQASDFASRMAIPIKRAGSNPSPSTKIELLILEGMIRSQHNLELASIDNWQEPSFDAGDFDEILNGNSNILWQGKAYKLDGFKALSNAAKMDLIKDLKAKLSKERDQLIIAGVAVIAVFVAICVGMFEAYKKAPTAMAFLRKTIDGIFALHRRKSIRKTILDETIREVTRKSLSDVDNESRKRLGVELMKAVETGDHELATALISALKKEAK